MLFLISCFLLLFVGWFFSAKAPESFNRWAAVGCLAQLTRQWRVYVPWYYIFSLLVIFFFSVKIVAGFFWGIVVTLRFLTRATWIAGNVHRFTNFVAKRRPCKLKGEFDNQFIETKMSYRQKRCLEESTLLPWKFIKSLYRVWIKATYLPAYHSASKLVQK